MDWITQQHDDYLGDKWRYIHDHLQGAILDELDRHLTRKIQGESDVGYRMRKRIASYIPHFARAVVSLAGMVTQAQHDSPYMWWDDTTEMAAPDIEGSVMSRLWTNVDGQGMDWPTMSARALIKMGAYQRIWGLVEGIPREPAGDDDMPTMADARGDSTAHVIDPLAVLDWVVDDGRLVSVKLKSMHEGRSSVTEKAHEVERYYVYEIGGYSVFEKGDDGEPVEVDSGSYTYKDGAGREALPIWTTKVPIDTPIGFLMARLAGWLFNLRNMRNFHLWASGLPSAYADCADKEGRWQESLWDLVQDLKKEGSSLFPTEIGYSAPPMDGAEVRNQTLEQETEAFFLTFFQSYGDAAAQKTATEVRQDIAQGVAAYLSLLTTALDEWESEAMLRLAQNHMPDADLDVWKQASVSRSKDFNPKSIQETISTLRSSLYGPNAVPAGETAKMSGARMIWDALGVEYDVGEVREAVRRMQDQDAQASDMLGGL
jgi:hypothetical protein